MSSLNLHICILAAGKGTRLKTDAPKALTVMAGKTLVRRLLESVQKAFPGAPVSIVVGYKAEEVQNELKEFDVSFVKQTEQLGTGHAVKCFTDSLNKGSTGNVQQVMVLYCDAPLTRVETLKSFYQYYNDQAAQLALIAVDSLNPKGLGRVGKADGNRALKITEEKDLQENEKKNNLINAGFYIFDAPLLSNLINTLTPNNAQKEYYLTDLIELFNQQKQKVLYWPCADTYEFRSVNDFLQMAELEKAYRLAINTAHIINGVQIIDPQNTYIDEEVVIGRNCRIHPNVFLQGKTTITNNVVIECGTVIRNCSIGDKTVIYANSYLEDSIVQSNVAIGPMARLRPKSKLSDNCKIGNFVEIKNTTMGENSKASHLAYIGDAEIGKNVNYGCGVITVNYDGKNKFKTIIKDGAFVGSDTQLVAPVVIGQNAFVAAGSSINQDVPDDSFAIARSRQTNKVGYKPKLLAGTAQQNVSKK